MFKNDLTHHAQLTIKNCFKIRVDLISELNPYHDIQGIQYWLESHHPLITKFKKNPLRSLFLVREGFSDADWCAALSAREDLGNYPHTKPHLQGIIYIPNLSEFSTVKSVVRNFSSNFKKKYPNYKKDQFAFGPFKDQLHITREKLYLAKGLSPYVMFDPVVVKATIFYTVPQVKKNHLIWWKNRIAKKAKKETKKRQTVGESYYAYMDSLPKHKNLREVLERTQVFFGNAAKNGMWNTIIGYTNSYIAYKEGMGSPNFTMITDKLEHMYKITYGY